MRPDFQMISIVIPCYNEKANIKRGVIDQVVGFLEKQPYRWELIIADDASTDDSLALCREFEQNHANVRVLSLSHGGKPCAIYGGIKEAKGEIVLFTDMDQSTPIIELDKLFPWFEQGYGVVIGSRGVQRKGTSFIRRVMSGGFRIIRRLIILPGIIDTQCGFKAMCTPQAKEIFPLLSPITSQRKRQGWIVGAFDVELLFIAHKWKIPIKEIEVAWINRDVSSTKGKTGLKFFDESIEMAKEILNIIWNNAKGRYQRESLHK
ncbi:MAG: glycosyltransferase [Anaerolineales bacterium]|nr:glycosyltransferase [Anaerolineales bacterium]